MPLFSSLYCLHFRSLRRLRARQARLLLTGLVVLLLCQQARLFLFLRQQSYDNEFSWPYKGDTEALAGQLKASHSQA